MSPEVLEQKRPVSSAEMGPALGPARQASPVADPSSSSVSMPLTFLPGLLGLAATAMAGLVLLGWTFDLWFLKTPSLAWSPMKANAAVGCLLLGLGLWLVGSRAAARMLTLVQGVAAVAVLLGALTLVEYAFGLRLGLDELLFRDPNPTRPAYSGRMAVNAALGLVALGLAMILLVRGQAIAWAQTFAAGAGVVTLLSLIGYLYGAEQLLRWADFTAIAFYTVVIFTVLTAGLLALRPHEGWMEHLTSDRLGSRLLRFLLPFAVLTELSLGWLRDQAQRAGLIDTQLGIAFSVSSAVVIIGLLIDWGTRRLDDLDAARQAKSEELERAYRDLHASMSLLNGVLEATSDSVSAADRDLRLTMYNQAYADGIRTLFGEEVALGRRVPDLVSSVEANQKNVISNWSRALQGERFQVIQQYGRPDLSQGYYELSFGPVRDVDGVIVGATHFIRDVSDRLRIEQEIRQLNDELEQRVQERTALLEAANRELEAFTYSVSHDLRAPLRAIDGFSQAVLEDYAPRLDDEGREYLQRLRAATQRMSDLIDALLVLSRLSRSESILEPVDLSAVVAEIAEELRAREPERQVSFRITPALTAMVDRRLITIALQNFLENAWKYTSKHPTATITFDAERRDGILTYFVRDDGAGFEMDFIDKLFRPFQRLHGAHDFPGLGIGLATVQRIIKRHGGLVEAEGATEHGATFYFTLQEGTST